MIPQTASKPIPPPPRHARDRAGVRGVTRFTHACRGDWQVAPAGPEILHLIVTNPKLFIATMVCLLVAAVGACTRTPQQTSRSTVIRVGNGSAWNRVQPPSTTQLSG